MNLKRAAAVTATTLALTVSVAGAASAAPAPTRNSNAPLTHYSGWHRLVDNTGAGDWTYADPDSDPAMTLGGGVWIEMRYPGRCTDPATGQLRVAKPFHRVTCG